MNRLAKPPLLFHPLPTSFPQAISYHHPHPTAHPLHTPYLMSHHPPLHITLHPTTHLTPIPVHPSQRHTRRSSPLLSLTWYTPMLSPSHIPPHTIRTSDTQHPPTAHSKTHAMCSRPHLYPYPPYYTVTHDIHLCPNPHPLFLQLIFTPIL